jgi:hypothetical protein
MRKERTEKLKFKFIPGEFDELWDYLAEMDGDVYFPQDEHQSILGKRVVSKSFVHHLGDGLWRLSWLETQPDNQSRGFGTAHMKKLLGWLRNHEENPARALVFEIENRDRTGLSEDQSKLRRRRGRFYERLSAQKWERLLLVPMDRDRMTGCPRKSSPFRQMELLWISLDGKPLAPADIESAARFVLCDIGGLGVRDPLLERILSGEFPKGYPRRYGDRNK